MKKFWSLRVCSNGAKFTLFYDKCSVLNYLCSVSSYLYSGRCYIYSVWSYLYSVSSYIYSVSYYLHSVTSYIYSVSSYLYSVRYYIHSVSSYFIQSFFCIQSHIPWGRTSWRKHCHAADLEIIKLNWQNAKHKNTKIQKIEYWIVTRIM